MDHLQIIAAIQRSFLQFVPLFRVGWVVTLVLGLAMLLIAFFLIKNLVKRNYPWIVGGIGLLMVISSGTQLIMSYL